MRLVWLRQVKEEVKAEVYSRQKLKLSKKGKGREGAGVGVGWG